MCSFSLPVLDRQQAGHCCTVVALSQSPIDKHRKSVFEEEQRALNRALKIGAKHRIKSGIPQFHSEPLNTLDSSTRKLPGKPTCGNAGLVIGSDGVNKVRDSHAVVVLGVTGPFCYYSRMAKLHFKYGAMNSGKSDTLIKTAYNYEERGLKVVVIKPQVDTRGSGYVVARGGHSRKADIYASSPLDLAMEISRFRDIACVLVDEAQFLTEAQISQLYLVAKTQNISVICYGLRADFRTELFPGSKRLLEIADNLEKLPTMCFCGSQAEFNTRKLNGRYVFEGDQLAIEGEGTVEYDSLCGACYIREGGVI